MVKIKAWESVFKSFNRFMNIIINALWVIGNFVLFMILSIAFSRGSTGLLMVCLYIVGGNIVKFVLDLGSVIRK